MKKKLFSFFKKNDVPILDKKATIKSILNRAHATIGANVDLTRFNKRKNDPKFLIQVARFIGAEIIYKCKRRKK